MPIVGHGIDLVENERIASMIDRHGERFLTRVFTEAERAYAESAGKRRVEHYAARFAAKEAVLKAIGTGWRSGIAWTDVEIRRDPSGRPTLNLKGRARELADELRIRAWHLSLSHTSTYAIASVIAEND